MAVIYISRSRILSRMAQIICVVGAFLGMVGSLKSQSWTNAMLSASQRASLLVSAMNFSELATMVEGTSGSYVGNIPGIPQLGVPALNLQDGAAGIGDGANNVTAFPAPVTLAATWDVSLARQYGTMLGTEAQGKGVNVLLGPMMNDARVYEDGRNFEAYGEDPVLSGTMAAAEIPGIQSQGVIATAKHFVCNDQETERMLVSADVNERSRQEVYYPPFRACVRAGLGAVMASYNRVNSRYACESEALNATLKKLWGFNGFVMSDWGATFSTVAGMNNGLDMDMYSGGFASSLLTGAIQSGNVPAYETTGMVQRILTSMFQAGLFDHQNTGNLNSNVTSTAHALFAREVAAEGTVLLQNNGGLLPLNTSSIHSIAVIGSVASVSPISTGAGSAAVNLPYNITPLAGITSRAGSGITVTYSQGDGASVSAAAQLASTSDVAIVCVGQQTSEGSDRASLSLPNGQDALVEAIAAVNSNTIVVMYSSSATLMPWASQVAAVLYAGYPGQENGNALAEVLFGDVNPSGKLPVTIPANASDICAGTPAQWPGLLGHVSYSEELQVGYRWYDANNVTPLFPFGFGLSYTTFGYSNLTVGAVSPSGQVQIGFDLTNTGTLTGAEVPQLYLGFPAAAGEPPKLLKGFQKVTLSPEQTQHVTFNLDWEDLANWDATARGWIVTPGTFQVMVGASSRDIRLTGSFSIGSAIPSSDLANAALHQPVTVSSVLSTNTPGSAAVDGDTNSAWSSLSSDPQWITVDLGLMKDLSRIRLKWNTNFASSYNIQISPDGTNWTNIYSTSNGVGGVEDILVSGRGRYVQMDGTAQGVPGNGYSLSEFEVYSQPQQPFGNGVNNLPGLVQAENYDTGGESVAYYNTTVGNPGGVYRSDDVGIEPTTDTGGGYDVSWLNNGEWLEYTVNVPDLEAIYSISARVASSSGGGQLRVRLNGTVLGTIQIPNTGGSQSWQIVTLPDVPLSGAIGSQALRLEVLNNGFSINWIELNRVQICSTNNIAVNQPITASSVQSSSYPASDANDGDLTTRWSSAFSDPQWITVDLGSMQNIARVRLNWENAYAQSYSIQLSADNSTWTNIYSTTNGIGSINDLAALGSGRYVRMYSTQRGTSYGDSLWEFEIYPTPQAPVISGISLVSSSVFVNAASNYTFTVSSSVTNIPTNGVQVIVDGIDVSSQLVFSGSPSNWTVSFDGLLANQLSNSVTINVTDAAGSVSSATVNNFDTFSQNNFSWEAEDFDFDEGVFINDPVPTAAPATNSYFEEVLKAVVGIDLTTPNNVSGETFAYRPNDSCGTQVTSDFLRQKYLTAGVPDYNVGWWYTGDWLNYTRTFPTNNFYIYGRLAGGNGAYNATNSLVTGGWGTKSQTTEVLGTFSAVGTGWQSWQWVPLLNASGQLAVVSLGGVETLKITSGNSLNANFYMLVPVPVSPNISVFLDGSNTVISLPTQAGFSYLVVYKNNLQDAYWKLLSIVTGDGTIKTVTDTINKSQCFYEVVM